MFVCPACDGRDTFRSEGNVVRCSHCDHQMTYDEYGMLSGGDHTTVRDFAAWQKEKVDEDVVCGKAYTAAAGTLSTVKKQVETLVGQGTITMTPEKLCCGDMEIAMADISDMAITGRRAIVFTAKKAYYEMIPETGFSAIKFLYYFESVKKQQEQLLAAEESAAAKEAEA